MLWLADLVQVSPAPNNGTEGALYDTLNKGPPLPDMSGNTDYLKCPYPDEEEYEQRANLTGTGCYCDIAEVCVEGVGVRSQAYQTQSSNCYQRCG